ncbi:hypothetical protein [Dongia sp.]|uniref:hypothetical protein n=1 Tax=Dongia sp. TaxID=1977262 RepID=UPI0035AD9967
MTKQLRDDEFEALLGRSLRMEAAPAPLAQRVDALARRSARAGGGGWFMTFLSPARVAASAAILSLTMGFAMGWGNATTSEEQDIYLASALYASNDLGDF